MDSPATTSPGGLRPTEVPPATERDPGGALSGTSEAGDGTPRADAPAPEAAHQTVVFVHVPKTAGTSLRNMLVEARRTTYPETWDISDRREIPDIGLQFTRHLAKHRRETVGLVMGHMPHGMGALFHNPLHVTVLRHPLARLMSSYRHAIRDWDLFRSEHTALDLTSFQSFATHPTMCNQQLQYFLDYDVANATTFMVPVQAGAGGPPPYLGVSFGPRNPVEIRSIRLIQRRYGPAAFKVQCSDDAFRSHVVDVPAHAVPSDLNRHVEIALPPNPGGTSWRVVPQADGATFNWYVVSMEMWEIRDGTMTLTAGALYEADRSSPRGSARIVRVWPEGAEPLAGGYRDNLVPEHAFDGRNALSLADMDGSAIRASHREAAEANLARFGAIGIIEDMPAFVRLLHRKSGYPGLAMRHDNVGGDAQALPGPHGLGLDPQVLDAVRRANAEDIAFYEAARAASLAQMRAEGIAHDADAYTRPLF